MLKKIVLFSVCFFCIAKLCHFATKGFSLQRISTPSLVACNEWNDAPLPSSEIFAQTFTYLGSGGSFYAFVSEDQKTVLKFFKHHHLCPLYERLPLPQSIKNHLPRTGKWKRVLSSCEIAYSQLREQTGILYLHLNRTKDLLPTVKIIDPIGIVHHISLDKTQFLLQQKAEMVYPYLTHLLDKGEMFRAKEAIDKIVSLMIENHGKGISDRDLNVETNFGFAAHRPIKIDVGPFEILQENVPSFFEMKSAKRHLDQFSQWLKMHSEELASYLEQTLRERQNEEEPCL